MTRVHTITPPATLSPHAKRCANLVRAAKDYATGDCPLDAMAVWEALAEAFGIDPEELGEHGQYLRDENPDIWGEDGELLDDGEDYRAQVRDDFRIAAGI